MNVLNEKCINLKILLYIDLNIKYVDGSSRIISLIGLIAFLVLVIEIIFNILYVMKMEIRKRKVVIKRIHFFIIINLRTECIRMILEGFYINLSNKLK